MKFGDECYFLVGLFFLPLLFVPDATTQMFGVTYLLIVLTKIFFFEDSQKR